MSVSCPILQSIYNPVARIIVIGDLHGDYQVLLKALRISGLIGNRSLKWTGGKAHLVQLGDIFDRYRGGNTYGDERSELKMCKLLFKLQLEAAKAGGCVHLIIGNHELMNLMGDYRYVSAEGHTDFGEYGGRRIALAPAGPFTKLMACKMTGAVKIGKLIFSHAGISYTMSKLGIRALNTELRRMLMTGQADSEFINTFWHREYSNPKANCQALNQSLRNLQADTMIVGHTVQDRINATCNNQVWRVDTGMSSAFGTGRRVSVLEILNGKIFNILR